MKKKLTFEVTIKAPRALVSSLMLDEAGYRVWTAPFSEGSYYQGAWVKGQTIRFLSPGGDGMVAEIAEHQPGVFVSIRHLGIISGGVEDTTSEKAREWAPAYENYRFEDTPDGGTHVTVSVDTMPEHEAFTLETYPKALAELKRLCERAVSDR